MGGGEGAVTNIKISQTWYNSGREMEKCFMKTKYKYFAGEIKETFHECLGCGNKRNISLCVISYLYLYNMERKIFLPTISHILNISLTKG